MIINTRDYKKYPAYVLYETQVLCYFCKSCKCIVRDDYPNELYCRNSDLFHPVGINRCSICNCDFQPGERAKHIDSKLHQKNENLLLNKNAQAD